MIGNSKFWHILKKELYIFPRARWTAGIIAWGPDILHSSVFDEKKDVDARERELRIDKMFWPTYAKRATDAARALFKVQRGKTPGSGSWMNSTDAK
eukprot:12312134-Karenia_brevis.AAC.1